MEKEIPKLANYCACFIDLLGQKEFLRGQTILPPKEDTTKYAQFVESATKSILAIDSLQKKSAFFMQGADEAVSMRDQIPNEQLANYEEMKVAKPKQQRWSDGLVLYHSLATDKYKCPMNAVADIFMQSGTLCLLGLADGTPVRGALEISWGVELHDNELYGAVVANSYELESNVAQYPRIVVGQNAIDYLKVHLKEIPSMDDKLAIYSKSLATLCLSMTAIDQDGHYIIDYLGATFKQSVLTTESESPSLYEDAYKYICNQYQIYTAKRESKLAIRYAWLISYFNQHRDLHVKQI